jgi:hypothetical protein
MINLGFFEPFADLTIGLQGRNGKLCLLLSIEIHAFLPDLSLFSGKPYKSRREIFTKCHSTGGQWRDRGLSGNERTHGCARPASVSKVFSRRLSGHT